MSLENPASPAAREELYLELVRVVGLLQEARAGLDADRAIQEQILATIEGLRRDVNNAGRTIGAAAAGGELDRLLDVFRRRQRGEETRPPSESKTREEP